jgi:hypothetical protein
MNIIYIGHFKSFFASSLGNTFSFPCQVSDINRGEYTCAYAS